MKDEEKRFAPSKFTFARFELSKIALLQLAYCMFDENKLVISVNETCMGEFVEDVWYNKELLEANYDYNDTMGKSYEAEVGWSTDQWRDEYKDPEDEDLSEFWEEYDAEFES